jgi:NAD(P)-dependent dehydrogenase (short-subunit alcohol dehydrogenase family)
MPKAGSIINPVSDVWNYDPTKHVPSLTGNIIVVTGGNSGTGKATVIELAKHNPKCIFLSARSKEKFDDALKDVHKVAPNAKVEFLELDLASFASVKQAAEAVKASTNRLDILINNAGIMGMPPALTKEGYELHFGTNHMGSALLTKLLLPLLLSTAQDPGADVRIVNLTSMGHTNAPKGGIAFETVKTELSDRHSFVRYGQSKLANILHARELARRYPSILSVSVHPGRVATQLLDDMYGRRTVVGTLMQVYDKVASPLTPEQGAYTQLWAATWPNKNDVVNGAYYEPFGKLAQGSKDARDLNLAEKLWVWQEDEFEKYGF